MASYIFTDATGAVVHDAAGNPVEAATVKELLSKSELYPDAAAHGLHAGYFESWLRSQSRIRLANFANFINAQPYDSIKKRAIFSRYAKGWGDLVDVAVIAKDKNGGRLEGVKVTAVMQVDDYDAFPFESKVTGKDGCVVFKLPPNSEIADIVFDKTPTLPDGRAMVLLQDERVRLRVVRGTHVEREYQPSGFQIKGRVEREILRNGSTQYDALPGLPVDLIGSDGRVLERTTTAATGEFGFFRNGDGTLTLIFPSEFDAGTDRLVRADPDFAFQTANLPFVEPAPFRYKVASAQVHGQIVSDQLGRARFDVTLVDLANKHTYTASTDPAGHFQFPNVVPGRVELRFKTKQIDSVTGQVWELAPNQSATQQFTLRAGQVELARPVQYRPEEHVIRWRVTSEGQAAPDVLVEVRDKTTNLVVAQRRTGDDGQAMFMLDNAGDYLVRVYGDDRFTADPITKEVSVHSDVKGETDVAPRRNVAAQVGTSFINSNSSNGNGELKEAVIDLAAYPVLTEATSPTAVPTTTTGGGVGGSSLGQIVDNALRAVLVWRPKATDHKGFLAALNQSFTCTETDGRSTCVWTPRSYAVQADLGAITGAQASIYTRAKAILDQSIPLLEGLTPLASAADLQDVEAERAIVESHLVEIVNELGVQGGPIVARVDALFDALLGGPDLLPTQIEDVEGQLRSMRDEFGFDRDLVNTIEEEQNLTNFIILFDNIVSLRQSWINQRDFFNRASGEEPFFGTQMVLLSRSLAVISESVHEVYYAMDSVFLDDAERHTVELIFTDPDTRLFVSELLGWTDRFASEEAPRLIADGGKSGVVSLVPTLEQLSTLVRGAVLTNTLPPTLVNGAQLPAGYRTARVQRALTELAVHLEDALELAEPITRNDDVDVSRLIGAVQSPQGLAALADQLATVSDQLRQLRPTDLAQLNRRVQQANGTRRAGRTQRNNRR